MKIIQSEEQNLSDLGDTIKYGKKSINYELLIDTTLWINSNSVILRGKNKNRHKKHILYDSISVKFHNK